MTNIGTMAFDIGTFIGTMAFDIGTFLSNATSTIKGWGALFIILMGVVMIIAAAWQIGKGLIQGGKGQTNWAMAIVLLLVGGAFAGGGYTFLANIADGGKATIEDLGNGNASGGDMPG